MPNVCYAEAELLMADDETGSKFTVREIINRCKIKGKFYYQIWVQKSRCDMGTKIQFN
jgi:hypothetical protein